MLTSETVRSDWTREKLKDRLLQSFGTTPEHFGFRSRTGHQPSQCKCHVKFACLKRQVIWVDLESLLIYLVWRDSGAPVCKRLYQISNTIDGVSYFFLLKSFCIKAFSGLIVYLNLQISYLFSSNSKQVFPER